MHALKLIIAALATTTSALLPALIYSPTFYPITERSTKPIESHHIDCRNGVDGFGGAVYVAQVGFPYQQGTGCANILETIKTYITVDIENYDCADDGFGNTELKFEAQEGWGEYFSGALKEAYPKGIRGFDCRNGSGGGK